MKTKKPFTEFTYQELFDYNSNISREDLKTNSMPIELERDMIEVELTKLDKMPKSKYKENELKRLTERDTFLEALLIEAYKD